jgi:hypothetical protein
MNRIIALLLFVIFLGSCNYISCDQLPKSYSSYDEAVRIIEESHFRMQEVVNTSKSSWVRGASYYSCDGNFGFFILKTDKQMYLYEGVPIDIWNGFKNAESFGSYYDYNIKHKFSFNLN